MPPQLASFITVLLILVFLVTDIKRRDGVSNAIWIVVIWMVVFGSRPVTGWFETGRRITVDSSVEGSPLDAAVFLCLILAGLTVLFWRRIPFKAVLVTNRWLIVFYAYCALSTAWSDYPFVALKRCFKDFGNVVLILVLLTEQQPVTAIRAALARCSYVLVLLSFLFVKYYPDIGRVYTGYNADTLMYAGVATQKNTLGALLLVACVFFSWELTTKDEATTDVSKRTPLWRRRMDGLVVLGMGAYLLRMADSATSFSCTVLAIGIFMSLRMGIIRRHMKSIEVYAVGLGIAWYVLDATFRVTERIVVDLLGRNMTLTNRTEIWKVVWEHQVNPLFGAGFLSFWTGDRLREMWRDIGGAIIQAHNGYLETYLDIGLVGLVLLGAVLIASYRRLKRGLTFDGDDFATLRLSFLIVVVIYNFSESAVNTLSLLWFVTLLTVMEAPLAGPVAAHSKEAAEELQRVRGPFTGGRAVVLPAHLNATDHFKLRPRVTNASAQTVGTVRLTP